MNRRMSQEIMDIAATEIIKVTDRLGMPLKAVGFARYPSISVV
jgi:hypothetical protein